MSYQPFDRILLKTFIFILFVSFGNTLQAQITANFEIIKDKHCENTKVRFVNTSVCDSVCTFYWDYGDGLFHLNDLDTVSYIFLSPGTYNVRLLAKGSVLSDTVTKQLQIYKNPVANFVLDKYEGCAPVQVEVSDNSTPGSAPIEFFEWDLRFGITRTGASFTFNYQVPGEYSLLLKITDTNGCYHAIEREKILTLYEQPSVQFSMDKSFSCEPPLAVQFTNKTEFDLPLEYKWRFNNADSTVSTNASRIFSEKGLFPVTLIGENDVGCYGEANDEVSVNEVISSFKIFQNGDTIENGDTICKNDVVLYNTSIGGDNIKWQINGDVVSFGDSILFGDFVEGFNNITLINSPNTNCADTVEKLIFVEIVTANFIFNWSNSCSFPQLIEFTDQSSNAVKWNWQLPQGNSSNEENPSHLLQEISGRDDFEILDSVIFYNVVLTVTGQGGCTASFQDQLKIDFPVAGFLPNKVKGCFPLEVIFSDKSVSISELTRWNWLVNGIEVGNDTINSLDYVFATPGIYETRLIVESSRGCIDSSDIRRIYVGKQLEPRFEIVDNMLCANEDVSFRNLSTFNDSIEYWHYRSSAQFMGECDIDPEPTIEMNPQWSGFHNVTLEVSNYGCRSSHTIPDALYIKPPVGNIRDSLNCENPFDRLFFTDAQYATSTLWDFGDGSAKVDTSRYLKSYLLTGDYLVKVKMENDTAGCVLNDSVNVEIRNIKADFNSISESCNGTPISFDASISRDYVEKDNVESFYWDFGDDQAPVRTHLTSVYRTFRQRGSFEVSLVAYDVNGCVDTASKNIVIHQPEVEILTDDNEGCTPSHEVTFKNISTDTTIMQIIWSFGDGGILFNQDSVVHLYESEVERSYTASLIAMDIFGCRQIKATRIDIWEPDAEFIADATSSCTGDTINLIPLYSNFDSIFWRFDDSTYVWHENKISFPARGDYTIGLILYKDQCHDTVIKEEYINIQEVDAHFAAYDTISQCYPERVLFKQVNIPDDIASGNWDFDYLDFSTNGAYYDSVNFYYPYPGSYTPSLTVVTTNGCTDSVSVPIIIKGPRATFVPSDSVICFGDTVSFQITDSVGIYDFEWFFGDGSSSKEGEPLHQYQISDTVYPALWITDDNGCEPPVPYQKIYVGKVASGISFPQNDTILCIDEILKVENTSEGGSHWQWLFDDGTIQNSFIPEYVSFDSSSVQSIVLIAQNDIFCSDTASRSVIVKGFPTVIAGPDDTTCMNNPPVILSAQIDSGNTVLWYPTIYMDDSTSLAPKVQPSQTTDYIVTVTDDEGCVNIDSTHVLVYPATELVRMPASDTTILLGESIKLLLATNNQSRFYWYDTPDNGCETCDSAIFTPLDDMSYKVQITDVCDTREEYFNIHVRLIYTLDVPDMFTPNGDGVNDVIYAKGGGLASLIFFRVFNRNGILVFQGNSFEEGWDGYFNGKLQKPDAYVFQAKALTMENETIESSGSFLLVY